MVVIAGRKAIEPHDGFRTLFSHMTTPKYNRLGIYNPPIELAPQRSV